VELGYNTVIIPRPEVITVLPNSRVPPFKEGQGINVGELLLRNDLAYIPYLGLIKGFAGFDETGLSGGGTCRGCGGGWCYGGAMVVVVGLGLWPMILTQA
jgi:hypothetical protein